MEGAAEANFCSVFAAGSHFGQSRRLCVSTPTATFVFDWLKSLGQRDGNTQSEPQLRTGCWRFASDAFQKALIGCPLLFSPSPLTLDIDPTAALRLPREMCQTAKTLFASKRHRIRGARHEQDLISRTPSQNCSSEILLVFFFFLLLLSWWGVSRHPGTKRGALITRL